MTHHRTLAAPLLAALSLAAAASAHADPTIALHYGINGIGEEWDYRGMGYADPSGAYVDLAGSRIVSSTVELDFTPADASELATLVMDMSIPVASSRQFFQIHGSDLVETTPGTYHYDLATTAFNGVIFAAPFFIESYGLNALGDRVSLPGTVSATSGFSYTVALASAVPEPASAALLLAGALALAARPRTARRRG